jgi:hypothetical protein
VWCEDEAGPYQTKPYLGSGWHPMGCPGQLPHEYQRAGTVKFMTLFHPATGMIRTKGASSCTNVVLHAWLKQELVEILQALPEPTTDLSTDDIYTWWESWREGLTVKATLRADPPPLRLLLVMDNLRGVGASWKWSELPWPHGVSPDPLTIICKCGILRLEMPTKRFHTE